MMICKSWNVYAIHCNAMQCNGNAMVMFNVNNYQCINRSRQGCFACTSVCVQHIVYIIKDIHGFTE